MCVLYHAGLLASLCKTPPEKRTSQWTLLVFAALCLLLSGELQLADRLADGSHAVSICTRHNW